MKDTMKQIFNAFVIVLMLFIPVETSYALSINGVKVQETSNRYALISWQTDANASSTVKYGTNASRLLAGGYPLSTNPVRNHTVLLSSLRNNTNYYFNVSSTDASGTDSKGIFNLSTTRLDTKAPFIDFDVPSYYGSTTLSVSGRTEPNAIVYAYVNNNPNISAFQPVSNTGVFSLSNIRLRWNSNQKTTANAVKIASVDPSGLRTEITKTVNVDKSPPAITFDKPIPKAIGERSLTVNGSSDEPATMSVYIDGTLFETFNVSSPWKTPKPLTFPTDKTYSVRFYAVDRAGNIYDSSTNIIVDTVPMPTLKTNLDDLTPSYIVERTIKGTTKPGATVIILINNRTTQDVQDIFGASQTGAGKIGGTHNIPLSISEAYQRQPYKVSIYGARKKEPLDYVVTADGTGKFQVDIELETDLKLTDEEAKLLQFGIEDAWKNHVLIYTYDQVGRNSSVQKTIFYSRCGGVTIGGTGQGAPQFTISEPLVSPSSLQEPVLKAGHGEFSLTMDLKYSGNIPREDIQFLAIPTISIQPGLSRQDLRTTYNMTVGENRQGLFQSAIAFPQRPPTTNDNQIYALIYLKQLKQDIFTPASFKNLRAAGQAIPKLELSFPLIVEIKYRYKKAGSTDYSDDITQRKCIGVRLLIEPEITDFFNPTNLLESVTRGLDQTVENIQKILDFLRPIQTTTIYLCAGGVVLQYLKTIGTKFTCGGKDIRTALESGACNVMYDGNSLKCDCSNAGQDSQALQTCCESTVSTLNWQKGTVDLLCDRIFCPSVPSLPKHVKSYADLIVESPGIPGPQLPTSYPITTARKQNLGNAESKCAQGLSFGYDPAGQKSPCELEFQRAWGTVWPLTDFPYTNEYDVAQSIQTGGPQKTTGFSELLRGTQDWLGNNFCSSQAPNKVKIVTTGKKDSSGRDMVYKIYRGAEPLPASTLQTVTGTQKVETEYHVDYGAYVKIDVKTVTQKESSGAITAENVVSSDTYFDPLYVDLQFDKYAGDCIDDNCKKSVYGEPIRPAKLPSTVLAALGLQNSKDYVINPTGGLISATKSLCLPAVNGYLISYASLMKLASGCFKTIAQTGKGNSESCQSLISTVVCDFVIDAISCIGSIFRNQVPSSPGYGSGATPSLNPFTAVSQAGESISETISNRYGDTKAYATLFNENALMHSICLFAFTGDWDISGISDLLTEATIVPVEPTCVAFPASRRFITSNPFALGKPTYLYYAGGMLSAGSPISSVSVKLICSNDNSCTRYPSSSNPNGQCDCFGQPIERVYQVATDQHSLKQGDVFNEAKYISLKDQEFRYDKVRVEYTYKDNHGKDITKSCEKALSDEGFTPLTCTFGPSGYRCEFNVGDLGIAHFLGTPLPKIADQGVYYTGERLNLNMRIEVISPNKDSTIPKYAYFITRNQFNKVVDEHQLSLDEGTRDYATDPGVLLTEDMFRQSPLVPVTVDARNQGEVSVVSGSATIAGVGPETSKLTYAVIFPDTTSYRCHDVDTVNGRIVIKPQTTSYPFPGNDPISGALIKCPNPNAPGVQFRILNPGKISAVKDFGGVAKDWASYADGTAFLVNYVQTPTTTPDCSQDPVDWKVTVTLYHSETTNPASPSQPGYADPSYYRISRSSPVFADGKPQEVIIPVKVACKRGLLQATVTPDFDVKDFSIAPSTIKLGDTISVNYRFDPIVTQNFDVYLNITNSEFPLGKTSSATGQKVTISESDAQKAKALIGNNKQVRLMIRYKDAQGNTKGFVAEKFIPQLTINAP